MNSTTEIQQNLGLSWCRKVWLTWLRWSQLLILTISQVEFWLTKNFIALKGLIKIMGFKMKSPKGYFRVKRKLWGPIFELSTCWVRSANATSVLPPFIEAPCESSNKSQTNLNLKNKTWVKNCQNGEMQVKRFCQHRVAALFILLLTFLSFLSLSLSPSTF